MTNVKLPKTLEPIKSAQKRSSYEGIFVAKDMERLKAAVSTLLSDVAVSVVFSKDAQGLTFFHGQCSAEVELICQRCNALFVEHISTTFCFSPVQMGENTEALPDAYEPVEVNDHGEIELSQLVEDELILSLPIVALHAEEACNVSANDMQFGEISSEVTRENPFAVLKELKRD